MNFLGSCVSIFAALNPETNLGKCLLTFSYPLLIEMGIAQQSEVSAGHLFMSLLAFLHIFCFLKFCKNFAFLVRDNCLHHQKMPFYYP